MAVGAALLILGGALIAISPALGSAAFNKAELGIITAGERGGNTTTAAIAYYQTLIDTENQAENIAIAGAVLASIGGAILVYGLAAVKRQEPVQQPSTPGQAEKT